jgi:hypothetical protein
LDAICPERLSDLLSGGSFLLLRDRFEGERRRVVLSAPPEAWDEAALPIASVTALSLEDIFIAIAGETTAEV